MYLGLCSRCASALQIGGGGQALRWRERVEVCGKGFGGACGLRAEFSFSFFSFFFLFSLKPLASVVRDMIVSAGLPTTTRNGLEDSLAHGRARTARRRRTRGTGRAATKTSQQGLGLPLRCFGCGQRNAADGCCEHGQEARTTLQRRRRCDGVPCDRRTEWPGPPRGMYIVPLVPGWGGVQCGTCGPGVRLPACMPAHLPACPPARLPAVSEAAQC